MSRKDYQLIADALRPTVEADQAGDYSVSAADVARHIANALAGDNPRFDRARFLRACGVE